MKRHLPLVLLAIGTLFLSGCEVDVGPTPEQVDVRVSQPAVEKKDNPRFTVVIVGEFEDDIAYGGKRRIYEITDHQRNVTWLSITGLDVDQHWSAKRDEERQEAISDAANALSDAISLSGD